MNLIEVVNCEGDVVFRTTSEDEAIHKCGELNDNGGAWPYRLRDKEAA